MKNIFLSIVLLFVVLLSVNFVSSAASPDYQFNSYINGLKLSSNLTLEKLMELCTQENCKINVEEKTVTLKSHYNNHVALILSQSRSGLGSINIHSQLPYDLNESCVQQMDEGGYACYPFILKYIDPSNYDWMEAVKSDLTYLKGIGLLDITVQDISSIVSLNSRGVGICNDVWINQAGCYKPCGSDAVVCEGPVPFSTEPFPKLPSKEFSLTTQKSSPNLIYWIIGIVLVVIILALVLMRKKK